MAAILAFQEESFLSPKTCLPYLADIFPYIADDKPYIADDKPFFADDKPYISDTACQQVYD